MAHREKMKIVVTDYDHQNFQTKTVRKVEECFSFKDTSTVTWINVNNVKKTKALERLSNYFGLHPLILEDILTSEQRPKIDDFNDYLYIVLRKISYTNKHGQVKTEQVSLMLGKNFVVSFQQNSEDIFEPIRKRIIENTGRIRKMDATYLLYCMIDLIIDDYFSILEKIGEDVEDLENELVNNPSPHTLTSIHNLKKTLIWLRKAIWPTREIIDYLEHGESSLIKDTIKIYLRDLYDHAIQIIDTIEISREMLSGMLEIYLSSISNRLNEVMKVLTIIATIFIPLTFIAGVYGMNFKDMPEISWHYGYPMSLILMTAVALVMIIYFKRKKWM